MNLPSGYVKLYRSVWNTTALKERDKKFSKLEAWLYIISLLASGVERNGLERGEFMASYRFMARIFNWTIPKTFRFIQSLISQEMLARKPFLKSNFNVTPNVTPSEILKVCNYETYNEDRNAERNTKRNNINKDINKDINNNAKTIIQIPLKDGSDFDFNERLLEEYRQAYPGIDIESQLKQYRAWAISNPDKRKTRRGILKSINFWLSNENKIPKMQNILKGFTEEIKGD
jgi:hypothetical protein